MVFMLAGSEALELRELLVVFATISRGLSPTARHSPLGSHAQSFLDAISLIRGRLTARQIEEAVTDSYDEPSRRYELAGHDELDIDEPLAFAIPVGRFRLDDEICFKRGKNARNFTLVAYCNRKKRFVTFVEARRWEHHRVLFVECSENCDENINWNTRLQELLDEVDADLRRGLAWEVKQSLTVSEILERFTD